MGVPLDAYVVMDNSVLSMLTDVACVCGAGGRSGGACLEAVAGWLSRQLNTIRGLTPDASIHCTDRVAAEYKPENGLFGARSGIQVLHCRELRSRISALLAEEGVDPVHISLLRGLTAGRREYAGKSGPKDPDLSLIALGLNLTTHGKNVYVLSNDDSLVEFLSNVCKRSQEVQRRWPRLHLLDGFQGITYLQSAHAACHVSNEQLWEILKFVMEEHVKRMADSVETARTHADKPYLSPQKAMSKYKKIERVMEAYHLSAEEKTRAAARREQA